MLFSDLNAIVPEADSINSITLALKYLQDCVAVAALLKHGLHLTN